MKISYMYISTPPKTIWLKVKRETLNIHTLRIQAYAFVLSCFLGLKLA